MATVCLSASSALSSPGQDLFPRLIVKEQGPLKYLLLAIIKDFHLSIRLQGLIPLLNRLK